MRSAWKSFMESPSPVLEGKREQLLTQQGAMDSGLSPAENDKFSLLPGFIPYLKYLVVLEWFYYCLDQKRTKEAQPSRYIRVP
ncbi:hypothetical protein ACSS6W_003479 [Trichoderma asperelloides]